MELKAIDDFGTIVGKNAVLVKRQYILNDDEKLRGINPQNYNILCELQPITEEQKDLIDVGYADFGDMEGFFRSEQASGIKVEVRDIVIYNDERWEIKSIVSRERIGNEVVFVDAILTKQTKD